MSDITEALVEAVEEACRRHPSTALPSEAVALNTDLWRALEQIGIVLLTVPEERGGSGGDLATAVAVLQVLGEHGATVPFAETALQAGWLLAESGAPIPDGPLTAADGGHEVRLAPRRDGWILEGEFPRVPWGRHASHLVALVGDKVVRVHREQLKVRHGENLAGEPRDFLVCRDVPLSPVQVHALEPDSVVTPRSLAQRGILGRLALMSGAARRALQLSVTYASERQQFGRPLSKFQAVQQHIAAMAGEVLLIKVAAEAAAQALEDESASALSVPAAKTAAGQAAGEVARLAHQVHGAIGFTEEHDLRLSTTRLWSWRDEFGSSGRTAVEVGSMAAAAGPDGLWSLMTGD